MDNSSEYLESSGTKIMMREPIEHQLWKDTNKQRNEINKDFFLVFNAFVHSRFTTLTKDSRDAWSILELHNIG